MKFSNKFFQLRTLYKSYMQLLPLRASTRMPPQSQESDQHDDNSALLNVDYCICKNQEGKKLVQNLSKDRNAMKGNGIFHNYFVLFSWLFENDIHKDHNLPSVYPHLKETYPQTTLKNRKITKYYILRFIIILYLIQ